MSIDAARKYTRPGAVVPVDMETTRLLVAALREAIGGEPIWEPQIEKRYSRVGYLSSIHIKKTVDGEWEQIYP